MYIEAVKATFDPIAVIGMYSNIAIKRSLRACQGSDQDRRLFLKSDIEK